MAAEREARHHSRPRSGRAPGAEVVDRVGQPEDADGAEQRRQRMTRRTRPCPPCPGCGRSRASWQTTARRRRPSSRRRPSPFGRMCRPGPMRLSWGESINPAARPAASRRAADRATPRWPGSWPGRRAPRRSPAHAVPTSARSSGAAVQGAGQGGGGGVDVVDRHQRVGSRSYSHSRTLGRSPATICFSQASASRMVTAVESEAGIETTTSASR